MYFPGSDPDEVLQIMFFSQQVCTMDCAFEKQQVGALLLLPAKP
jgi:hypothetical protein